MKRSVMSVQEIISLQKILRIANLFPKVSKVVLIIFLLISVKLVTSIFIWIVIMFVRRLKEKLRIVNIINLIKLVCIVPKTLLKKMENV